MDFLQLIFDHFWEVFIFLLIFGGSIGAGIRWMINQSFEHRVRMQKERNEELRLQIQLEQARSEHRNTQHPPLPSDPLPKDADWDEQVQSTYEMGYQQIQQNQ